METDDSSVEDSDDTNGNECLRTVSDPARPTKGFLLRRNLDSVLVDSDASFIELAESRALDDQIAQICSLPQRQAEKSVKTMLHKTSVRVVQLSVVSVC